jgi:hypothetical protein
MDGVQNETFNVLLLTVEAQIFSVRAAHGLGATSPALFQQFRICKAESIAIPVACSWLLRLATVSEGGSSGDEG